MSEEFLTCGICGAVINKETEKTHYDENSNACKIQEIKKENEVLKQKVIDLEKSLGKTQELLNPQNNADNADGGDDDDRDDW